MLLIKLCSCQYAFSGVYLHLVVFGAALPESNRGCAIFANAQLASIPILLTASSSVIF